MKKTQVPQKEVVIRPLHEIAKDILEHWKPVSKFAEQHVAAMKTLDKLSDIYVAEDGRGIVLGFLVNAGSWKGEDARRIKAELNMMLKLPEYSFFKSWENVIKNL